MLFTPLAVGDTLPTAEQVWNELNSTAFVDNTTTQPVNLTPDKHVVVYDLKNKDGYFLGNLAAWVDISFKDVARINGVDYVDNITKSAVVQYDVQYRFSERCKQCRFDSIYRNISIRPDGPNITAWLNITFRWHEFWWFCGDTSCYPVVVNHTDYLNISNSAIAPRTYDADISNIRASIVEYNNTVSPKTTIELLPIVSISKIDVTYNGSSITHKYILGAVESGATYANYSTVDAWNSTGNELFHFGDLVVIKSADVDYSKLKIYVSSPYHTEEITSFNRTRIDWKPEDAVNPWLFYYFAVTATLCFGIYIRVRMSL